MKLCRKGNNEISVLMYNILAGGLGTTDYFPYVSEKNMDFKGFRQKLILKQIKERIDQQTSLDVFVMVEVDNYWTFLKESLRDLGYNSVYSKRPSFRNKGKY